MSFLQSSDSCSLFPNSNLTALSVMLNLVNNDTAFICYCIGLDYFAQKLSASQHRTRYFADAPCSMILVLGDLVASSNPYIHRIFI